MELLFLGTGTSHGIPVIACNCKVCTDAKREESKNNRTRCSVLIRHNNKNILIDTSQDFRKQMLDNNIKRIDSILFTHDHADHVFGLPDLRTYNQIQKEVIDCYCSEATAGALKATFSYIFNPVQVGGGIPKIKLNEIDDKFNLFGLDITPIKVKHGIPDVFGYRIKDLAYIPDVSYIPEASMNLLKNLDVLVLDALKYDKHPTHLCLSESVEICKKLNPKKCYFTHITHEIDYNNLKIDLPEKTELAYDGLKIKL